MRYIHQVFLNLFFTHLRPTSIDSEEKLINVVGMCACLAFVARKTSFSDVVCGSRMRESSDKPSRGMPCSLESCLVSSISKNRQLTS